MVEVPICTNCGKDLDRVDHVGTERYILDRMVYRDISVNEGIASDTDVRCGYCGYSVDKEARAYFYRRWIRVLEVTGRN